jgi:hypothetical protein
MPKGVSGGVGRRGRGSGRDAGGVGEGGKVVHRLIDGKGTRRMCKFREVKREKEAGSRMEGGGIWKLSRGNMKRAGGNLKSLRTLSRRPSCGRGHKNKR